MNQIQVIKRFATARYRLLCIYSYSELVARFTLRVT